MVDTDLIRGRFQRLSRSELVEELAKRDDYSPEAFAIMEEVASELGIAQEERRTEQTADQRAWRRKLKTGEVADWYKRFDKAAHEDESAISNRDMSSSTGRLLGGMLIANGLFFGGLLLSLVILPGGLLAYLMFLGGIVFLKGFLFHEQDPLELRRWKRCWQADFLGYHLGGAVLGPLLVKNCDTPECYMTWSYIGLAVSLGLGMLTGLVWAHIKDKTDKDLVVEAYRAWKIDRSDGVQQPEDEEEKVVLLDKRSLY